MLQLTDDPQDFQKHVEEEALPVVLDFWAPWCGPCVALNPVIEALAEENEDEVVIAKVNVDDCPQLASKFGVRSIPTLVFWKKGEKSRVTGSRPKAFLQNEIDELCKEEEIA